MARAEKVDAVIVGAGAAASVYAAALAEAGRDVLVLESGPARRLEDLYSSQIWARRLKWATPHVVESGEGSIWHNLNAGRGVGGAAVHHYAVWPRYHEDDFEVHSRYGRALDWPLSYQDLRPWYDRVQRDVGIAGDAAAERWRPPGEPYPLPPVPRFPQAELIAGGFEALDMQVAPLPLAVLTEPYKGRPACIWDGWCDAGCPIGALANPLVEYFPRARKAGAVLQADSHVTRVLTNGGGRRAVGVEYVDAAGERREQRADLVVLAAFTVESVRILLNSGGSSHPGGLGNTSGLLGRYLMSHPSVAVFGLFDDQTLPYMGATGGQLLNQDHFAKTAHEAAFGSRQWAIAQALKPNDLLGIAMSRNELFGPALQRFMGDAAQHVATMVALCEDQPLAANRVSLADRRDAFGMPLAEVTYAASADGVALYREALAEGQRVMEAAGAREVWAGPMGGQHVMGGAVMGHDPARSVTDGYCRLHEVPNVVVASPSVYPTSSAVNCTYTLHALVMRSADRVLREWPA